MEKFSIEARNILNIPIRLMVTNVGLSHADSRILITIGPEGASLKSYYRVCIDTDISPDKEWQEIGSLYIETKSEVSLEGLNEGVG